MRPLWLLFFLLVWWILADPRPGAWIAAALAVVVGGGLHAYLVRRDPLPGRIRLQGMLLFVPYFLWQSLRGGLDVARRAFSPGLPLAPGLVEYRSDLPPGLARVFFVTTLSLLPGTFSADLDGGDLTVHLLASDAHDEERLRELEGMVARIFGAPGA